MDVKLTCEIVTPVHIGSGKEIDPFDYVVKQNKLYRISLEKLLAAMNPSEIREFEAIIDSGDLIKIRAYIAEYPDLEKMAFFNTAVTPYMEAVYGSNLENPDNQMLINMFLRSAEKPLVPGSSIKGSIRTAFLSAEANSKKLPFPKGFNEIKFFESNLLEYRDAKNDPFRAVRFRDAFLKEDDTIIRQVVNVKIGGSNRESSIPMNHEVSNSTITGKPVIFENTLSIDEKLYASDYIKRKIGLEEIISSCRKFYRDKMEYEHLRFYKGHKSESASEMICDTPLNDNEAFIRIGRFSGVESVTLDKYRNPKPPGKQTVWGTSRNLVEGIYPMGWVKVNFEKSKIDINKLGAFMKIPYEGLSSKPVSKGPEKSRKDAAKIDFSELGGKFKLINKDKKRES